MKKFDKIIQILQEELIKKKKSYFSLAQATKILKDNGILTPEEISNGFLKNALEKGLIPQAKKTSKKPRQWRIHKDKNYIPNKQVKNSLKIETKESEKARGQKKAKALINTEQVDKNNKNRLIFMCPICGVDLTVPGKYIRHDELKCYHCHGTFKNPIFYPDDSTIYKKYKVRTADNAVDKSINIEMNGSKTRREKNGCIFGFFGFSILLIIGSLLCLTGVGCLLGIPLILAAILFPIINTKPLVLRGPCPYCGYEATATVLHHSFDCQTCKQRIIIENGNFYKLKI